MTREQITRALDAWVDRGGHFVGENVDTLIELLINELESSDRLTKFLEAALPVAGPSTMLLVAVEDWAINPRFKAMFLPGDPRRVSGEAHTTLTKAVEQAFLRVAEGGR